VQLLLPAARRELVFAHWCFVSASLRFAGVHFSFAGVRHTSLMLIERHAAALFARSAQLEPNQAYFSLFLLIPRYFSLFRLMFFAYFLVISGLSDLDFGPNSQLNPARNINRTFARKPITIGRGALPRQPAAAER